MSTLGDKELFDESWQARIEASYNHFSKNPQNQIQLAFMRHHKLFSSIIWNAGTQGRKMIETGAGRGSLSSHFAEAGWDVTLLDWSDAALDRARRAFDANDHKAHFVKGDVLDLKFPSEEFDFVTNIGLLEHFDDIEKPLIEHWQS